MTTLWIEVYITCAHVIPYAWKSHVVTETKAKSGGCQFFKEGILLCFSYMHQKAKPQLSFKPLILVKISQNKEICLYTKVL